MRTAEEVASFVVERVMDISALFRTEDSRSRARMNLRLGLMDVFRLIEPMLRDGEDILYAIPTDSVSSSSRQWKYSDVGCRIMAVFTADRCIFLHNKSTWFDKPKKFGTFSYDEVVEIKVKQAPLNLIDGYSDGELIVCTTTDILHFETTCKTGRTGRREKKYYHFDPDQACGVVTDLVMKYKQAKYAAQQGGAAPQYRQQTPPPQAPRAAGPQETSQWADAQRDAAQQTAARLAAALQAPAAPQAQAAPAAPRAGAGLSAETVEALKQLKNLLDAGILTQEEFDAKKRQLLGL